MWCKFWKSFIILLAVCKSVISIEPDVLAIDNLKHNIELNGIKNITLINCGVGSKNIARVLFFCATGDNLGASSFIENFSDQNLNSTNVSLRTLDSMLTEIKVKECDFLKIDVEGFDYEVLKGAYKTISSLAPVIQIEYIPRDKDRMLTFLKENPN